MISARLIGAALVAYGGFVGCAADPADPDEDVAPTEVATEFYEGPSALRFTSAAGVLGKNDVRAQGVSLVDYSGDGLPDITVAHPGGLLLFTNTGDSFARDLDRLASVPVSALERAHAVVWADTDDDGDLDLLVTRRRLNDGDAPGEGVAVTLLRNTGATLEVAVAGLDAKGFWEGAAFGDLDGDGDLDLVVIGGIDSGTRASHDMGYGGTPNKIYRNQGDGTFVDISSQTGCTGPADGEGWGLLIWDADKDGDQDIFITNDFRQDTLCVNDGTGHFADASGALIADSDATGTMGIAAGDLDGDGCLDLWMTDFGPDRVYGSTSVGALLNRYGHVVDNVTDSSAVRSSWGVGYLDADLDGDMDVITVSAYDRLAPGQGWIPGGLALYENRSGALPGSVIDVGDQANSALFTDPAHGYGLAHGDVDGDGDLDVVIGLDGQAPIGAKLPVDVVLGRGPLLLRNDTPHEGRGFVSVVLSQPGPNGRGVGSEVTVELSSGRRATRVLTAGASYLSSHAYPLHFGLGSEQTPARVIVRWPDGFTQAWTGLPAGRITLTRTSSPCVPEAACDAPVAPTCRVDGLLASEAECAALCDKTAACGWLGELGFDTSAACKAACSTRILSASVVGCVLETACEDPPPDACGSR